MTTATKPPIWGGVKIPVIGVAGEKFSGKTLFASSIDPKHTFMIDLEKSSETYSIPFARREDLYGNLQSRVDSGKNPTPLDAFLWFKETCEAVKPGEFSVLAVDPITDIEAGLADWVRLNPKEFGRTEAQYAKASGLMWADVKNWWKMFLGMLSAKVETFVFTAHMGNEWKGTSPTSRRIPKGKETLFELASLYLLMERKPDAKGKVADAPSAVVLKSRLAKTVIADDGEVTHQSILPPRLDVATPKTIRQYEINPPDYKRLKKGELAPEEQVSDADLAAMKAQTAADEKEAEQLKLNRLEMMQQAANRQRTASSKQPDKEAEPSASKLTGHDADGATTQDASEGTQATSPGKAAPPDEGKQVSEPDVYTRLESQRQRMSIGLEKWNAILAKRSARTTRDLTEQQASAILTKLLAKWDKDTSQEMVKS